MKILMAGLPGSGKTTQAIKLEKELKIPLFRTGDIFRDLAKQNTASGKKVKKVIESGGLVEDKLALQIIKQKLTSKEFANGFVMDGFPRTVKQIAQLDPEFDHVFYLQLSEDEIRRRLSKRGRFDDTPQTISRRLMAQEENMLAVLGYYKLRSKCQVHEINAQRAKEQVHAQIRSCLGNG